MLDVTIVTRGSPSQVSGGHLYHRRMAERAAARDARLRFVSTTAVRNPWRHATGVVLVDSLVAAAVAPWVWRRPRDRPLAAIIHQPPGGIGNSPRRTSWQRRLDCALYRRCDLLIVTGPLLARQLVEADGLRVDCLRVIPPGHDLPPGGQRVGDLRGGRRIALLTVANWLPNKGILDVLEAVAALPADDATLHLVGRDDVDRDYAKQVRTRLRAADLAARVVVHGVVQPERVADLYAGADVFVFTSYAETYGMVVGEASAAGLPTVGWRTDHLRRHVTEDADGCLVDVGDIASLSAALHRLSVDGPRRHRLAAAARRRGQQLPTWDAVADDFYGALSQLAARPG